jgi:alpha-tubulin suppressor-like RCC1 family protein
VHCHWNQTVALKADGTLWISPKPTRPDWNNLGYVKLTEQPAPLTQFGSETNWSSVINCNVSVLLTKNDGTLWRWGVTNYDWKHDVWTGLQTYIPHRVGTESNWAEVFESDRRLFLRKTDGNIWGAYENLATTNLDRIELEPNFFVSSLKPFAREKYHSTAGIYHGLSYRVGVRDDGTFRIWSDERVDYSGKSRYGEYKWFPADLQIGHETNWLAVSGNSEKLIALKKDGTLWLWNFHQRQYGSWKPEVFEPEIQQTVPVQLGTHTDWIAINGSTALAADGSVWLWPLENSNAYYDDRDETSGIRPLLDISHKPQLLGNVFSAAE